MKEKKSFIESNAINIRFLLVLFFSLSTGEVIAEFFQENFFIYLFKPLLMPTLTLLYWVSSKNKNLQYVIAMFFAFLANIFFISKEFNSIVIGTSFLTVYRILIILIALKYVPLRNFKAVFIGSIPFVSSYAYFAFLTVSEVGTGLYVYLTQVVLMSFFGGYALSNYMLNDTKLNYWLMLQAVLFALIQFMIILKIYYLEITIFQPLAMILYVFGQYALYKFLILSETNQEEN